MKILYQLTTALGAVQIIACSPQKSPPNSAPYEILADICATVDDEVNKLSKIGLLSSWENSTREHAKIINTNDIDKALVFIGANSDGLSKNNVRAVLTEHLIKSNSAHRFSFECDTTVIVFFDEQGKQLYIYPQYFSPFKKKTDN